MTNVQKIWRFSLFRRLKQHDYLLSPYKYNFPCFPSRDLEKTVLVFLRKWNFTFVAWYFHSTSHIFHPLVISTNFKWIGSSIFTESKLGLLQYSDARQRKGLLMAPLSPHDVTLCHVELFTFSRQCSQHCLFIRRINPLLLKWEDFCKMQRLFLVFLKTYMQPQGL